MQWLSCDNGYMKKVVWMTEVFAQKLQWSVEWGLNTVNDDMVSRSI